MIDLLTYKKGDDNIKIKAKLKLEMYKSNFWGNHLKLYLEFKEHGKMFKTTINKILTSDERNATFRDDCNYWLNINNLKRKGEEMIREYFKNKYESEKENNKYNNILQKVNNINKQKIKIEVKIKN